MAGLNSLDRPLLAIIFQLPSNLQTEFFCFNLCLCDFISFSYRIFKPSTFTNIFVQKKSAIRIAADNLL